MTTQPGALPVKIEKLRFEKLPNQIQDIIRTIAVRMKKLEILIKQQAKRQKQIEVLDKS